MATPERMPTDAAWLKEIRGFSTAAEFERATVQATSEGAMVLCATGRLARRLMHRCRQMRLRENMRGWETPPIRSFRGWIRETYEALWQPRRPITPAITLSLWHQAIQGVPVPGDLIIQPALYFQLQASLDALLEAGLNPLGNVAQHQLASFRRESTERFLTLMEHEGVALWRDIVLTVSTAIAAGRIPIPRHVILAGFENVPPLERIPCDALAAQSQTSLWRPEAELRPTTRIRLYATPEQECRAVCADVLHTWNSGARNLAVVFADRVWFSILKRCFDDLAGLERPDFEQAIRYNLTIGTPLIEHPLFQTAVIPLRLPSAPDPVPLLTSLLVSPYVRKLDFPSINSLRTVLWTPDRTLGLNEACRALSDKGYPMTPFQQLTGHEVAPLGNWLAGMEKCLAALGFCRFDGQHRATDALAQQHLEAAIRELTREAGAIVMSASTALAWLTAAAEKIIVAEKTPETAGIQILNPTEARGLAFDHLWVVGAHGAVLPPPSRDWPFLDPDAQKLLEGGTIEYQWEQGKRQLAALLAAAPHIFISRAASGDEETPYLPCPLVPDETDVSGKPVHTTYNLWQNPTAEWMRARWLRDGWFALMHTDGPKPTFHFDRAVRPLSGEFSITAIEDLAACPFQFFVARILKLEPLALADDGIDPRIRGKMVHDILKTFVDGLPTHAPDWPDDEHGASVWLERVVTHELGLYPNNLFWQVERLRLLGDSETPGILHTWLDQERERAQAGWQFVLTEASFEGLAIGGIIMRGRVDRIDHHAHDGFAVWDYKSGATPSITSVIERVTELQLPAYLLALQRGLISNIQTGTGTLQAGYISLKKAADVNVTPLTNRRKNVNWLEILPQWELALTRRLEAPRQGRFDADPCPGSPAIFHERKGACELCEFFNLCGFFDQQNTHDTDNEDGEEC